LNSRRPSRISCRTDRMHAIGSLCTNTVCEFATARFLIGRRLREPSYVYTE
jgi:hypothetical protein